MPHNHEVRDVDAVFAIDPVTKEITHITGETHIVQGDHNSEIVTIKIPRTIEGHDMTQCDVIQIHSTNTGEGTSASNTPVNKGITSIKDLVDDEDDPNAVLGRWSITKESTVHAGTLGFKVKFICYDSDDQIGYELNTRYFNDIPVYESSDSTEDVVSKQPDVIVDLEKRVSDMEEEFEEGDIGLPEIYVGDGDMPEDATIQIILDDDEEGESTDNVDEIIETLEAMGLISLVRADENTVYTDKNGAVFMF